jgi:hypothetical protein
VFAWDIFVRIDVLAGAGVFRFFWPVPGGILVERELIVDDVCLSEAEPPFPSSKKT